MVSRATVTHSLAVIGDMHVLDGGKKDNWDYGNCDHQCRRGSFIQAIFRLRGMFERVAQVGDAWDLWQGYMWQIKRHVGRLVTLVMDMLDYVYGNHDEKMRFEGFPEIREYLIGGRHLGGVLHGHQFDPWNSGKKKKIGMAIAKVWGFFEMILPTKWARWIENKVANEERITPGDPQFRGRRTKYEKGAVAMARKRNWKWVVIGHTHKAKCKKIRGIMFIDSGMCLYPHFQYAWLKAGRTGNLLCGVKKEKI